MLPFSNSEPPSPPSGLRRQIPRLLALPDLLILYGALLLGVKIQEEAWRLPHTAEWRMTAVFVLGLYGAALVASGVYRRSPRRMHLPEFLRVGGWLGGAWALSMVLPYTIDAATVPPQGVLVVLGLGTVVGILGLRAGARRVLDAVSDDASHDRAAPSLHLDDLVPRDPVEVDRAALRDVLSSRTVLVTGAGGSIGAELSRQLVALRPFRLVLVDVSERNLYELERTLRADGYPGDLDFCIADVRDASLMDDLLARHQPDVVVHTAAYKHVPLMERHPAEAFRNNTQASVQLLHLCEQHDVDRFVFVSTDKAVHPSSVLGATKQLAEWYVRTSSDAMQCTTVRFGNVFGTEGSVVPRFEEKLAAGEPLPVTHPDMERYFMSPEEACGLILQTLLLDNYPTYIFRMGDPIRIEWLAKRLIQQAYPDVDPETMIEYVGRRPGEKLSEELVRDDETVRPTDHSSILGLEGPVPHTRTTLDDYLQRLRSVAAPSCDSRARLRQLLLETPLGPQRRTNGAPRPSLKSQG